MASDEGSPPLSPGILEASKELEEIIQEIAEDPSPINSEDVRLEILRRYDLARRDAGTATLSRVMRVLKDQTKSSGTKVAMMKVLDYLMDVKNGVLADAIGDERRLEFFKNHAKKTKERERRKRRPKDVELLQAILELFDKWGKHYEAAGAMPGTGGAKIAATWRELMKDGVHFPHSYEFLTLPPAPADAGAFSMATAPPAAPCAAAPCSAASGDLNEAQLGKLADEMQLAMEQHGKESVEFGEAQAHFESTLEQWQRAVEMSADGDPGRFAELFDVVSRYAERQQNILAGKAPPLGAAPAPTAPTVPASPSTGSRVSWDEEVADSKKKHRRKKSRDYKLSEEVATPSFGEWQSAEPEEMAGEQQGSFGGNFSLQSFPSFGPDGGGFGVDGFGSFGPIGGGHPGEQPGTAGGFGEAPPVPTLGGPGFGRQNSELSEGSHRSAISAQRRVSLGEASIHSTQSWTPETGAAPLAPLAPVPEAPVAPAGAGGDLAELCRKLAMEVQQLKSQAEQHAETEQQLEAAQRRIQELEGQDTQSKYDSAMSSLRDANMQMQAELDQRGQDLAAARKRALEAERLLGEKDEVFSDTCQRLLDAQRRIAQLEDQLSKEAEVQQSLENRLQGAKAQHTAVELELKQVRHALGSVTGIDNGGSRRSNVPYRAGGATSPTVNQADELAASMPEKTFRRPERDESLPSVLRSSLQTWQQTPRMWMPPGALLRRPASHDIALATAAHFRELLGKKEGVLYEDHQVLLSLSFLPPKGPDGSRRKLPFEVLISNRGGHPIHDIRLQPAVQGRRGRLLLEPQGTGTLWPTTALRFQGSLEVYGVDDIGPQVDLSYLQPDNQSMRARLRIPFTSRFLGAAPSKTLAARWDSAEFLHTEVACVCEVRASLVSAAAFSVWQALEMGDALKCLPGMAGFRAALLAGCFEAPGESVELLLHAELGLPKASEGQHLCRLAVRSTSALVNRAVAQAAIDVLCDPRAQSGSPHHLGA